MLCDLFDLVKPDDDVEDDEHYLQGERFEAYPPHIVAHCIIQDALDALGLGAITRSVPEGETAVQFYRDVAAATIPWTNEYRSLVTVVLRLLCSLTTPRPGQRSACQVPGPGGYCGDAQVSCVMLGARCNSRCPGV